jgi:hypothetical protein
MWFFRIRMKTQSTNQFFKECFFYPFDNFLTLFMPIFSCHLLTFISFRRGLRHDKCIVATQHFCGVSTTEVTSFVVLNAPAASWQTWLFLLRTNPSPLPNRILILSVKYVSVLGARGRQQKQQTSFPTNVILKQISPKLNISHIGTFNKAFFHFKYVSTK